LWNTRYLAAAVARLRAEGHDIKDEDVTRLSPLKDRHLNFLGRYLFNIHDGCPGRGLRPLRDPDTPEDDDEDRPLTHPIPAWSSTSDGGRSPSVVAGTARRNSVALRVPTA
jgi:hypothetical protein